MTQEPTDTLHHVIPRSSYFKVYATLIVLTFLTVVAARFDFGAFNTVIAFGIATVKAVLVMAIFMHLKYDDMLHRVIIGAAFFFLVVLYFFCFIDDATRIIERSTL
jgi:cytochrome c oxidase subunit 4